MREKRATRNTSITMMEFHKEREDDIYELASAVEVERRGRRNKEGASTRGGKKLLT